MIDINEAFIKAGYTPAGTGQPPAVEPAPPPAGTPPPAGAPPVVEPTIPSSVPDGDEPPPAGTPPVEPPPPAVENPYKGIAGGKYTTPEEINDYLDSLEKKTKEDPFVNDQVKGLNEAIRNGIDPELYLSVSKIKSDKLSDKEALALKYQMKDGLSPEDAEFLVNETYRLDDELFSKDEPATRSARLKAQVDAREARTYLDQFKADALTPPREKQVQENSRAWENAYSKVTDGFQILAIEGKTGTYQFPVSADALNKAEKVFRGAIEKGLIEVPPDQKGIDFARTWIRNELERTNMSAIIDHVVDGIKTQRVTDKHNPRGIPPAAAPPATDETRALHEWIAKQKGVKLRPV